MPLITVGKIDAVGLGPSCEREKERIGEGKEELLRRPMHEEEEEEEEKEEEEREDADRGVSGGNTIGAA